MSICNAGETVMAIGDPFMQLNPEGTDKSNWNSKIKRNFYHRIKKSYPKASSCQETDYVSIDIQQLLAKTRS